MSNIHRISDFERNNNNSSNSPLLSNVQMQGDPRKESFCSFLKTILCPRLKLNSFIFIISVIDIVIYVLTLCFGIEKSTKDNITLLGPKVTTLDNFGALNPLKLRTKYELWRWVTYSFLHVDFVHIFSNLISQIIIGSYIESLIGTFKTIVLYFSSAVIGALFAVLIVDSFSVGASIAIMGILGAYIAFYFINWNYLDTVFGITSKYLTLFIIFFFILMNFSSQINNTKINNWGHLGGLLSGFFLSFILVKPIQPGDGACCNYKIWFILSSVITGIFTFTGFLLFYTLDYYINY